MLVAPLGSVADDVQDGVTLAEVTLREGHPLRRLREPAIARARSFGYQRRGQRRRQWLQTPVHKPLQQHATSE